MTLFGCLEIVVTLALVLVAALPLGRYMAAVFTNGNTALSGVVGPIETSLYKLAGVDPDAEQTWIDYASSMVLFTGACFVLLYGLLRLQGVLWFNPQGFSGVAPGLAFNIAVSFVTNANWQAYGGESTLSLFSQMAGLTAQNFLDSAVAIGMALTLVRSLARGERGTVGNFWVDVTRSILYILLPFSAAVALIFVALGVPQTVHAFVNAVTLEGPHQTLAVGPIASQEAIKLLGNNGGGFFNANSAHPFENPSPLSNLLQNWCHLVLPVALVIAFGKMIADERQSRAILLIMGVLFLAGLATFYVSEAHLSPALTALGVDGALGNMEGKDLRFGQAGAALFAEATTGTGTGASDAVLESMTPLSGLAAMFNLLMGCISPGGVGTGLYSFLLLVILAAFISGLMVGRTPEYLGKKVETREMRLVILAFLVSPILVLGFGGAAFLIKDARDSLGASGPHGFTEMLYAYASSAADNGSGFAGLNANTPWFNVTTGVAMLAGRLAHAIPILAIAGSLAAKKKSATSAGTLPSHGLLFCGFTLAVIVVVTLLQYVPMLALGPIAEHLVFARGGAL